MSTLLHIIQIKLVPQSEITVHMTDSEIKTLGETKVAEKHTPGSAILSTSQKPTIAGVAYQSEITWSIPKMLDETLSDHLLSTGAILLKTIQGRDILIYRNDVFKNTRFRPQFDATTLRSQVTFSITSIKPLF